jgi:hypothetical protein
MEQGIGEHIGGYAELDTDSRGEPMPERLRKSR